MLSNLALDQSFEFTAVTTDDRYSDDGRYVADDDAFWTSDAQAVATAGASALDERAFREMECDVPY